MRIEMKTGPFYVAPSGKKFLRKRKIKDLSDELIDKGGITPGQARQDAIKITGFNSFMSALANRFKQQERRAP